MYKSNGVSRTVAFVTSAILVSAPLHAETPPITITPSTNLCLPTSGFYHAFFNGVWNTAQDAADGAAAIATLAGFTHKAADTGQQEDIRTVSLYNTTGSINGATRMQDVAEVFIQRTAEVSLDVSQRWELFWDVVRGDQSSTWEVIKAIAGVPALTVALFSAAQAKATAFIASIVSSPPTDADMSSHNATITRILTEKKKLVMVAHSQGNLFLNAAYDKALTIPTTDGHVTGANVKAVHVAPASVRLSGGRGAYTLADIDLVIRPLALLPGGTPSVNLNIPLNSVDVSGHMIVETYLDSTRAGRAAVNTTLMAAFDTVIPPKTRGEAGFFTSTLTWNGGGDVDLHVSEPDNTHVFYNSTRGRSGALDTDNTVANGPEHYTSTCDSASLQTGTYKIGVNNYRGATGRTATITISTSERGEIYKNTSINVGPERGSGGNGNPVPVVTVKVAPSPIDRVLEATIAQ